VTDNAKATIQHGDKTITFEGPADFVERQVQQYALTNISASDLAKTDRPTKEQHPAAPLREKDLIAAKRPKNHPETVTVLAFALAEGGAQEFSEEDIRRAYLRAGVRPPKVVGQALRDAKNVFDYIEPGSEKGMYRLTTHGDRTVRFDLPGAN
jgi:hypothetical protein